MTELSIVIVNYKSWESLENCIDSILNGKFIKLELIVVDNNSNDNKIDQFKTKYKTVKWIENNLNYGFSKACNIGASISCSEWILFLNPDTEIPKNCLKKLMEKVQNTKNTIYSIKQLNKKNKDTHAYGIFLNLYSVNGIFRFFYRLFHGISKENVSKRLSFSPHWISGSFFLIRKQEYKKLGGWDEDFWMYYEDMDMCKRANKININTLIFNDIHCYHYHGKSSRINFKTKINSKTQVLKSSIIYINKHFNGYYAQILKFLILSSKIIELIILSLFIKEKRILLKKILKI